MKISTIIILFISLLGFSFVVANSDHCKTYFPMEKGTTWEYQELDKKGEISGFTTTIVEDVKTSGESIEFILKGVTDGPKKKEKDHYEQSFSYTCVDGVLKMDLKGMIPQETIDGMESMEIELTQDELILPFELNVGDKLNDGTVNVKASTNGFKVMDMTINITDRKVEKIEEVTTPSGTYSCVLITYNTAMNMGFVKSNTSSKDWYSPEVGIVKSEVYDKDGALSSSRILTGYSK